MVERPSDGNNPRDLSAFAAGGEPVEIGDKSLITYPSSTLSKLGLPMCYGKPKSESLTVGAVLYPIMELGYSVTGKVGYIHLG